MIPPDTLITYKLPNRYRPGSDLLCKGIIQHQAVIDLITSSLLNVPNNTYTNAPTEFPDNTRCDACLLPRLATQESLPPIVIEFQSTVNDETMNRGIVYCTQVYRRYKKRPILLTICIKKVSPATLLQDEFTPCSEHPFMYQAPSPFWANRCLLLSRLTIEGHIEDGEPLHPLVALTMFLTYDARCIMVLPRWDDATVQELYSISKQVAEELVSEEDEKLKALHVISEVHEKQYNKIKACLLEGPPNLLKALKYVEDGKEYSARLKQKYDTEADRDDTPAEAVTPLEEPPEITNTSSRTVDLQAIQFIDTYKERTKGQRMNWKRCYDQGVLEGKIASYTTSASLRVSYTNYKKRK